METKKDKKIKDKRILTPIISVIITLAISCFITFLLRTTSDVISFRDSDKKSQNSTIMSSSVIDTTINMIDTVQNRQIDSIKYLNETIIEIKKDLDRLKQQQKTNSKSAKNISDAKPDTVYNREKNDTISK